LLPEEYKWECQGSKRGKKEVLEVKLAIKKKRQEKGEEEGRLEKYVLIGNKWWKIMTTYNKEMKKTTRGVDDTIKESREGCMLMGERTSTGE
jgi:hypothetical protein